ncbi:MAG: hypothetical protein ACK5MR_17835 [Cumulibacter sp.]
MAHFAGLVAAGLHPNPVPYADVVSSTTHKTLGGPRGGFIISRDDTYEKRLNQRAFPGQRGGPLMHIIAAKATAFLLAASEHFADRLLADDARSIGVDVLTGGTDVHVVLADLRASQIDGKTAETVLHQVGITANRNSIPYAPGHRWSPPVSGSAPRPWLPAGSPPRTSPRSPTSSPQP